MRSGFRISPNFILLLAIAVITGVVAYLGLINSSLTVFLFVAAGWIISLCLHEFGHALAAYYGGDFTVADKGYLSLDPLKYTHPILSIVFPLVFLLMGGIGLPGGAVYIRYDLLISRQWRSLASTAGPLGTLACFIVLWIPFLFRLADFEHPEFWAGWALLAFLQLTALFINLLPIPGLDGFGILEPWLPYSIASAANAIRPYGFLILFLLFSYVPFVSNAFFSFIFNVASLLRVDLGFVSLGFDLFRFWSN